MKKTKTELFLRNIFLFLGVFSFLTFVSCKEEEDEPTPEAPVASFQYEVSDDSFLMVTFSNFSQNADSYSWNFGDGQTSTEENPTHTYAEAGSYTVVLTASNSEGATANFSQTIEITDPAAALRILVGDSSKEWHLIREGAVMGVGPAVGDISWWSLENTGTRPCVFSQTWTFNEDGTMTFDDGGAYWGDDYVFGDPQVGTCFEATSDNMVNKDGVDVSAWLSGTHSFDFDPSAGTLTVNGLGAYLGLIKVTPQGDVRVPQQSITYDVDFSEEDLYDLMVVSVTGDGFYWQFNYVSYHDWANEPEVVSFMVDFTFTIDDYTVTFENQSKDATSYSWDFGDGSTSTEENPTHIYTAEGAYDVTLTGTGNTGTKEVTKSVSISLNPSEVADAPTEDAANVISVYSDAYTDIANVNLNPNWGQATSTSEIDVAGEKVLKMAGLNYQGIDFADNIQDVSGKTMLHIDIYSAVATDINISLISSGPVESPVTITTEPGVWKSIDINLSEYTAPDLTQIIQFKFDDAGTGTSPTIFVDNIYFY